MPGDSRLEVPPVVASLVTAESIHVRAVKWLSGTGRHRIMMEESARRGIKSLGSRSEVTNRAN